MGRCTGVCSGGLGNSGVVMDLVVRAWSGMWDSWGVLDGLWGASGDSGYFVNLVVHLCDVLGVCVGELDRAFCPFGQ